MAGSLPNPATPRASAGARRAAGFSLIELMITVAIIALLAAVAYPMYTKQILRGQRSAGQNFLMDLAARNEQFFNDNKAYATNMGQLGYPVLPQEIQPNNGTQLYNAPVFNAIAAGPTTAPGYNISLAPFPGSNLANHNDGTLWVNSLGQRYRSIQGGEITFNLNGVDCTFEDGTCIPK
jgi:type IV pilus assembly protein PilE